MLIFIALHSWAKNPGKRFQRCPNWKDVNISCGLFGWLEEDDRLGELSGGGVATTHLTL
ncbi:putative DNA topoisomerase 3-alpha-like [Sesbania bispinosa]|nr:putative DNA topoisomerase 3-alpha-like [Sesbania bispinosa]